MLKYLIVIFLYIAMPWNKKRLVLHVAFVVGKLFFYSRQDIKFLKYRHDFLL